ncbi:MAG TPA: 30S ribosome-binding factor RbfA [Actinomycetes bacterium]|jgi:ribosome-binding factor A|nr:30S ribosome-binding factor RbfA [Actinomycetes bacterium]
MAKPSYPRSLRLAETVRRLIGEWLEEEQNAERQPSLVTVTDVRVTRDLHRATVYYTVLGGEQERADAQARLDEAAPQARAFVARQVRLRHAPTLEFVSDDVPARAARIDRLLAELGERPDQAE